jgi:hypothetical protein
LQFKDSIDESWDIIIQMVADRGATPTAENYFKKVCDPRRFSLQ